MTRLAALLAALKTRLARLIGGHRPLTFTQSYRVCERCKAVHPSSGLHLVGKM